MNYKTTDNIIQWSPGSQTKLKSVLKFRANKTSTCLWENGLGFSLSKSDTVVHGVELCVVRADEDISEDPQRASRNVNTEKSTQTDGLSSL